MSATIEQLAADWLEAKEAERQAVEARREIEDAMRTIACVRPDVEGTSTLALEGYQVKIITRIDRKVDADLVQQLAAEAGLTEHLSSLLRWKPEINMTAWRSADPSITRPLAGAITAKPGRPSFSIETINPKE